MAKALSMKVEVLMRQLLNVEQVLGQTRGGFANADSSIDAVDSYRANHDVSIPNPAGPALHFFGQFMSRSGVHSRTQVVVAT
jgi:hypothetical protein